MKKQISLLLVLVMVSGVSAKLDTLTFKTSVVSSWNTSFQPFDVISYTFYFDLERYGIFNLPNTGVDSFNMYMGNDWYYAEAGNYALVEKTDVSSKGGSYNVGIDLIGANGNVFDAGLFLGTDYHSIIVNTTYSEKSTDYYRGVGTWENSANLNLVIFEKIRYSPTDSSVVVSHFPIRVKPTTPPKDVPEPSVATSLLFGLAFLSGTAVRRFLQKKR